MVIIKDKREYHIKKESLNMCKLINITDTFSNLSTESKADFIEQLKVQDFNELRKDKIMIGMDRQNKRELKFKFSVLAVMVTLICLI